MHTIDGTEILRIENLDVFYGKAHVLQQVSLALPRGVLAVVGRNGMGKTTLCRAVTGMVPARGSVRFNGREILGLPPNQVTHAGIAYVPQGRRVWRSLTVDETLQLSSATARKGPWTVARVYQQFPRLAERRGNGGAQLSGGEQQMLAIARALLFNPSLLVMDEPTEGLAPVIVEQVATLLRSLADEGSVSVLLIEQNLGVALEVADRVAIMVNGRIAHELPAAELAADKDLQQRMLGLRAGAADAATDSGEEKPASERAAPVLRVVRSFPSGSPEDVYRQVPVRVVPAVYLVGDFKPGNELLAQAARSLEQAGARVVRMDIGGSNASTAQVGLSEIMGYGRELADALRFYLAARNDVGALLVIAPGDVAPAGLAAARASPTSLPVMLITHRSQEELGANISVIAIATANWRNHAQALVIGAAQALAVAVREETDIQRMRRTKS